MHYYTAIDILLYIEVLRATPPSPLCDSHASKLHVQDANQPNQEARRSWRSRKSSSFLLSFILMLHFNPDMPQRFASDIRLLYLLPLRLLAIV